MTIGTLIKCSRALLLPAVWLAAACTQGQTLNPDVVLSIDMSSGVATILNTNDSNDYNLDSYEIHSDGGLLDPSEWQPIAPSDGWQVAGGASPVSSINALAEFTPDTSPGNGVALNLPSAGSGRSVGGAFTTDPAAIGPLMIAAGLGNEYLDVEFFFSDDDANDFFQGTVVYENERFNNLVLEINTVSGGMTLINESAIDVQIDLIEIVDPGTTGALNAAGYTGLTALDRFPGVAPDWIAATTNNDNGLAEFFTGDGTSEDQGDTILSGESLSLGNGFNAGAQARNLVFSFHLTGTADTPFGGEVRYIDSISIVGDYNNDGSVDAADYTVWRDAVGQDGSILANRDPSNTGVVDGDDYNSWSGNYGASAALSAASAVPEPTTAIILLLGVALTPTRGRVLRG